MNLFKRLVENISLGISFFWDWLYGGKMVVVNFYYIFEYWRIKVKFNLWFFKIKSIMLFVNLVL